MISAMTDPHRIVRITALEPVASFGVKAMDAVPILEKWIGIDDEFSHVTAIGHISMIAPSKADELLPVLVECLKATIVEFDFRQFGYSAKSASWPKMLCQL